MRTIWFLPLLAACGDTSSGDVVGPFTGQTHRYVVDRFELPVTRADARAIGDDLDGDGSVDNALGGLFASLQAEQDLTTHAADMIAAGVLQTVIEIQADDLVNDPSVGVRYLGAAGTPFGVMGGTLVDGRFVSNRSAATSVPGAATILLPVFADADPSPIDAYAMELSFVPEPDGSLDARVAGAVDPLAARAALVGGIRTMIAADPQDHVILERLFDANSDGMLSDAEIANNTLITGWLSPDLDLFDGTSYAPGAGDHMAESLSFGFALHLVPCASGTCAGAIADTCHDRVRDGDETGLDCGGSCGACPGGTACTVPGDCQSHACTGGTCAAPSCTDGVLDGFEREVDCGSPCGGCAGDACQFNHDCASGQCNGVCV